MQVAGRHFVRTGWPHVTNTSNAWTIGHDPALSASTIFYQVLSTGSTSTVTVNTWPSSWVRCDHEREAWGNTCTPVTESWVNFVRMPHTRVMVTGGETREQREARALREAAEIVKREEAAKREKLAREAASKRARSLLVATMTPEQRKTYEERGYFDVVIDGKTYRISQGSHGNVALLDERGPVERYCVQPAGVPTEDMMLAQKLALECFPAEFFRKANVTRIRN